MKIRTKILDARLGKDFPLPGYAKSGDAGVDLRAMIDSPLTLQPGEAKLLPTGLSVHVADPGFFGAIYPRSGRGHKEGLVLGNSTGIIDSAYTGPLMVSLLNRSKEPRTIQPGDRIAQLVIQPVVQAEFEIVDEHEDTERACGGFGSTGVG